MTGCGLADRVQMAVFNRDALFEVMRVQLFLQRGLEAGAVSAFDPERVAGDQGFAECDQIAALRCGLVDAVDDLG